MSEDETTTEVLAEIEGQATEYTPPDGWRVVRFGEQLLPGDMWVNHDGTEQRSHILHWDASAVSGGHCIRRIEPQPQPQPQPEPQPVQVREGRWRTRGGEIRNVTPTPDKHELRDEFPWWDASNRHTTWRNDGRYSHERESMFDLLEYLGPIQPEPQRTITPDDVAAEALAGVNEWPNVQTLQRKLETTEAALLEQQQRNEQLVTQGSQQRMQIEELRSEVSHVQGLLGESRKAVNSEARDKADLQHRLDVVSAAWAQQCETARRLQIELDAREQVPQAISDRFEEGWDAGTARAVETIAEWTEPFRTCGSQSLALAVLQNLPHIMRSLTGLAEED